LRIYLSPAAATTTDLRRNNLVPILDCEGILNEFQDEINEFMNANNYRPSLKIPLEHDNIMDMFEQPVTGIGRKAQLTIMTVEHAIGGMQEWMIEFCNTNKGWIEFSVASILLWASVIDRDVLNKIKDAGLFKVPIMLWTTALKPWANDVRRYNGIGLADIKKDAKAAGLVRKIGNLSGRDLQDADFQKEKENTKISYSVKGLPTTNSRISYKTWNRALYRKTGELARLIEESIAEGVTFRKFNDWWETRRAWIPTGSSSEKHRMKELRNRDDRIKASDRPNKAQVTETFDMKEIINALNEKPVAYARASTKPEPGFKRRALYASDDISTYIASFASADIEKSMAVGGMVAKQTPSDVMQWLRADTLRCTNPERIWLSLDYADFNKEHSKLDLYMLNLQLTKMWLRFAQREKSADIMLEKAICAFWTAKSHLNAYCRYPSDEEEKHYSGLWSGHRDTARDNTMLHWCYRSIMLDLVNAYVIETGNEIYAGICGDDEDALHADWVTMTAYVGMHQVCGMHLNTYKQLADWYTHEFLQRQANIDSLPIRPIAPMIATLSTGSWYKQSHTYYDTVVQSMSDNCLEIISRGADAEIMIKVIVNLINRMMTINVKDELGNIEKVPLEWWAYRHGIEGRDTPQSLWYGSGSAEPAPKLEESKLQVHDYVPRNACRDWLNNKSKWLKQIDSSQIDRYEMQLLVQTYKSFYGNYRSNTRDSLALEVYGIRKNFVNNEMIKDMIARQTLKIANMKISKCRLTEIWAMIDGDDIDRRPMDTDVLLNTLGLDRGILQLLDGWKGFFKQADHDDIAKWDNIMEIVAEDIPEELMLVDSSIRNAWINSHTYSSI
jgi:hypothetical protein